MDNCRPHLSVLTFETKIMVVCLKLGGEHLSIFYGQERKGYLRLSKDFRRHEFASETALLVISVSFMCVMV